jgi:hypothetical protein
MRDPCGLVPLVNQVRWLTSLSRPVGERSAKHILKVGGRLLLLFSSSQLAEPFFLLPTLLATDRVDLPFAIWV